MYLALAAMAASPVMSASAAADPESTGDNSETSSITPLAVPRQSGNLLSLNDPALFFYSDQSDLKNTETVTPLSDLLPYLLPFPEITSTLWICTEVAATTARDVLIELQNGNFDAAKLRFGLIQEQVLLCFLSENFLMPVIVGALDTLEEDIAEVFKDLTYQILLGVHQQELEEVKRTLGPQHPQTAAAQNNLAVFHDNHGDLEEAKSNYERALALLEKTQGPKHPHTAIVRNNLAGLHYAQGHYLEAERLYKLTLRLEENRAEIWERAVTLNNLAVLYGAQGRYKEAKSLLQQALEIFKTTRGMDDSWTHHTINNLAELLMKQRDYKEAKELYERVVVLQNNAASLDWSAAEGNADDYWAYLYEYIKHSVKRYIVINGTKITSESVELSLSLSNLAALYHLQGQYDKAKLITEQVLDMQGKLMEHDHFYIGLSLNNLATLQLAQGNILSAEPVLRRANDIFFKSLGPDHPYTIGAMSNLSGVHYVQQKYKAALSLSRSIMENLPKRLSASDSESVDAERRNMRNMFMGALSGFARAAEEGIETPDQLWQEAFKAAQLAHNSKAGVALRRMAARFANADAAISKLVDRREKARTRLRLLERRLITMLSKHAQAGGEGDLAHLRQEIQSAAKTFDKTEKDLRRNFPNYFNLISSAPIAFEDLSRLIKNDEAVLAYLVTSQKTFLFVLRPSNLTLLTLDMRSEEIVDAIGTLRSAMNVESRPFNLSLAHHLYQRILEPALPHLKDVRHLILVPDGPLESFPFSLLITEHPERTEDEAESYRQAAWLDRRYTLATLPSVSSLKALRGVARRSNAPKPFLGIGDPAGLYGSKPSADVEFVYRAGRGVDVKKLADLRPIPNTRVELVELAKLLRADPQRDLYLGQRANETNVRRLNATGALRSRRILAFATHGLTAGELQGAGQSEPGLVLTPPEKATEQDDGLLAASEIALLNLDAEWVILSACNTATGDGTPNAGPLSGLARAFFYAGSRALLVSHWYVNDQATAQLLTATIRSWSETDPAHRDRAAALTAAREALRTGKNDRLTHPNYWAPFTLIGDR